MCYHALAALRYNALSVSCFLSFSVTSNQSHCLWFSQVRRKTVPLSGCCHASFSIYLLVTRAFRHQLQSRSATTHCLHIICGIVRVRSKYASVYFCRSIRGASQHRSWGWIWGRQGRRPVGSRWEEVLYTARLKHLVHVRIMCRLKTLRPGSC